MSCIAKLFLQVQLCDCKKWGPPQLVHVIGSAQGSSSWPTFDKSKSWLAHIRIRCVQNANTENTGPRDSWVLRSRDDSCSDFLWLCCLIDGQDLGEEAKGIVCPSLRTVSIQQATTPYDASSVAISSSVKVSKSRQRTIYFVASEWRRDSLKLLYLRSSLR